MACIQVKNFSFQYPGAQENVLHDISFCVESGEMVLLFGASGSGKTTLLANLKKELAPKGQTSGKITVCEKSLARASDFSEVGFVLQSPDHQMVADTVERELAFGAENMQMPRSLIQRRIAEISCYFGLGEILHKKTAELSGGQKQLCNLAAVLCMDPSVLILDEPLAQLDPIAAEAFLQELCRVNRELGITVILSEHFTENILPFCSKVIFLEDGRKIFDGSSADFAAFVLEKKKEFTQAMPAAAVLAHCAGQRENLPLCVNEGKNSTILRGKTPMLNPRKSPAAGKTLLAAKEVWYAYDRGASPVLRGADIDIRAGEVHGIVGGNGEGKSTFLNILAGCYKPARGRVKRTSEVRIALLPQEPKLLFCQETLLADLSEFAGRFGYGPKDVRRILERFRLAAYAQRHPYDLSGGEMQLAALAKLLLLKPNVLLLDEPVKGLDVAAKKETMRVLTDYAKNGNAVVAVSHDLDFIAAVADRVTMLSRGATVCAEPTADFLQRNRFFTTSCARLTAQMPVCALTAEEVVGFV